MGHDDPLPGRHQHSVHSRCTVPSAGPVIGPGVRHTSRNHGIACKTIFDCTVPFELKDRFHRAKFKEVDVKRFIPGFNQ